jgi:serine phosphatase RsbU (regulator of sigma subunit)
LQREALLSRILADRETLTDSLAEANAGLSARNQELALREQELQLAHAETARLLDQQTLLFRRLQESLLDIPTELPGVKLGHLYRSATEQAQVGGDFYDLFEVKEGKIAVLIGDVAGHGIDAARTATLVKDVVHAFIHQTLRTHEVLKRTNRLLIEKNLPAFVTLFLGILDTKTGELVYSSAGHPDMLVRRASGEVEHLGAGSSPLGIYADAAWKPHAVELEANDLLVLFTDGVIEARRNGELFGEKRLDSLVKRERVSPERLPQVILDRVLAFSEGTLRDDVAILTVLVAEKGNMGKANPKPFNQEKLPES